MSFAPPKGFQTSVMQELKRICPIAEDIFTLGDPEISIVENVEWLVPLKLRYPYERQFQYKGGRIRVTEKCDAILTHQQEQEISRICRVVRTIGYMLIRYTHMPPIRFVRRENPHALSIIFQHKKYSEKFDKYKRYLKPVPIIKVVERPPALERFETQGILETIMALCVANNYEEKDINRENVSERAIGLYLGLLDYEYKSLKVPLEKQVHSLLKKYKNYVRPNDPKIFEWLYREKDPYDAVFFVVKTRYLSKIFPS